MAKIAPIQCAKCGACTVVCPVFQATGRESLSARGRLHLLEHFDPALASAAYAEILSQCLLCGACRPVCSRGLDPPSRFLAARERLARKAGRHTLLRAITRKTLSNPALLTTIANLSRPLLDRLPADSGLRLRLGLPTERAHLSPALSETIAKETVQPPSAPALAFFPGCYATHLHREIGEATEQIAVSFSGNLPLCPQQQCCCGLAAENAGDSGTARRLAKQNINAFADHTLPILTSCASCYHQLRRYPTLLAGDPEWQTKAQAFADRLLEFSAFVAQSMKAAPTFSLASLPTIRTVVYHDPCHLRFAASPLTAAAREIIQSINGLCLTELTTGPQCCGQGGLFHLAQPKLAEKISNRLLNEIEKTTPDLVTTTCSGCLIHIQQGLGHGQAKPEVRHLAMILADLL